MQLRRCRQAGQAMTEFVVVASFVLVPAFLLLPMVGKLVDMKQASIQAARYMAWEYTAWNPSRTTPQMLDTFSAVPPPVKPSGGLGAEAAQRVFSGSELPITTDTAWSQDTANPVWTEPNGLPLYVYDNTATKAGYSDQPVPDPLHLTSAYADVGKLMSQAESFAHEYLFIGGNQQFDAVQTGGYVTTDITMPALKVAHLAPFDRLDLAFHAQAALVARGWDAGGGDQTRREVQALVPTVFFNNPVLDFVRGNPVVKALAPDIAPDKLKFGYVDTNAMPSDYLGNGSTRCNNTTGLCE